MNKKLIFSITLLFTSLFCLAQNPNDELAQALLNQRKEVNLKIELNNRSELYFLSKIVSVENIQGLSVLATANLNGFSKLKQLNFKYEVLLPQSLGNQQKGTNLFSSYPSFTSYISMMRNYAATYPTICKMDTIGFSVNGLLIPVLKISKNVHVHEAKPQFWYSSTIHGDETGEFILMLHLIDYLLTNYGKDATVTSLVDQIEIWINPLSNPDGTYFNKNNVIFSPTRYNANGVDLNRNFRDPQDGLHPDLNPYQKENIDMMAFMAKHQFSMSANFHAGTELLNYPWDTWGYGESGLTDHPNHPDRDWFIHICQQYADTIFVNYPKLDYLRILYRDGYVDGYNWYAVAGGRQDYMTYFRGGREVTVELDRTKITPPDSLQPLWNKNYKSLLNYMKQVTYGFSGLVTDSVTGKPLYAKLSVLNHDVDSSWVFSDTTTGFFQRPIVKGTYSLLFSAPGYYSKLVSNQFIDNESTVKLAIKLKPITLNIESENVSETIKIVLPVVDDNLKIVRLNSSVAQNYKLMIVNSVGQIVYQQKNITLQNQITNIQIPSLKSGMYIGMISLDNETETAKGLTFKIIKL